MRRRRTLKRLNRRSAKKSPASGLPNSATHNFPAPADLASPHSPPANSTKLTHTEPLGTGHTGITETSPDIATTSPRIRPPKRTRPSCASRYATWRLQIRTGQVDPELVDMYIASGTAGYCGYLCITCTIGLGAVRKASEKRDRGH